MDSTTKSTTPSWRNRYPIFRFLGLFILSMALFYLFYYSDFYRVHIGPVLEHFQAKVASGLLGLLGYNTSVTGDSIEGTFSVNIAKGCDGLEPLAMLVFAILVFPISSRYKWPGLLSGVVLLFILNLMRIAGLYLVGLYYPAAFDFLHLHGGFVIFTLLTFVIWMLWANWAFRKMQSEKKT